MSNYVRRFIAHGPLVRGVTAAGAVAVALSACDSVNQKILSADEASVGPFPTAYREMAREYLRKSLFDPYSVRDAQISKPKMGKIYIDGTIGVYEPGWLVCFRANSKNRMGAYTGISDTELLIRGDRVVASFSSPVSTHYEVRLMCGDEKYEPFSELEEQPRQVGTRPR